VTGFWREVPEKNNPQLAHGFLRQLGLSLLLRLHAPTLRDPGAFEQLQQRAVNAQAELISIADRGAWDWRVVIKLIRYCRQHQVAIWHGHDYKSNALGLIVRQFCSMKLVTTVHGWVEHTRRTPIYYAVDRCCLPFYDEVLCVSDDLYDSCLKCGVPPQRCHLIPNAIDVEAFQRRTPRPSRFSTTGPPLVVGAMGRLASEKGFDLLIQAVAQLNAEGGNCVLRIAGEGPQRDELRHLTDILRTEDTIELLGQVNHVPSFFESLDLFVLSSRREGLPNVLLEAMAMEVPVAATRIAGIPRLIESGVNGILIAPESVEQLKHAIRLLATDHELRHRLAAAARSTVENSFSFHGRMDRVAAVYDHVLGRHRQPEVRTLVKVV
jgi:glycosyltransferase involved in cell wall biosynthesis